MKRKKTYTVEVVFSTSFTVDVKAEDVDEAMCEAEHIAAEEFADPLNFSQMKPSDFICEAQTP